MDINNLLLKYFGGKASKEELTQLEVWKKETTSNLSKMKEMKELWDNSSQMTEWDEFDKNNAWNNLSSQIKEDTIEEVDSSTKTKVFSLSNIVRVAVIGLLLLMSKYAYEISNVNESHTQFEIHYSATDISKDLVLPDGTEIVLSANSTIDITESFLSERNVTLRGNAFFKVKRDESSPFIVHTSNGNIKVLGTEFSVLNHHQVFELFVKEGKVSYEHEDHKLILGQDDLVSLKDGNIIKSKMYNSNYLSWKDKKLVFRNAQWMDVFKDINRHYHKRIDFSIIKQSNCTLNTTIGSESIIDVLNELEILWNLKYHIVNDKIHIISVGC